jgi:hypothetical protein
MKINEAFPSNFLKAEDLRGRRVPCTITAAVMEEIGQGRDKETKLILSFAGKEKKMVCNKTNATSIAKLYGDDTDFWIGKVINIEPREIEFGGELVWGIRVCLPAPGTAPAAPRPAAPPAPAPAPVAAPAAAAPAGQELVDDDVPF